MPPRVHQAGESETEIVLEDDRGNTFRVPKDVVGGSFAERLKASGPPSTNIEDRRAETEILPPRAPDALFRGMPQTPLEWKMYEERVNDLNTWRETGTPVQRPSILPRPEPTDGDPAGIEAQRAELWGKYGTGSGAQPQPPRPANDEHRNSVLADLRRKLGL